MQNKKSIIGLMTILLLITASIGILTSCEKKFDEPFGENSNGTTDPEITVTTTIKELKALHTKGQVETLDQEWVIEGVINASDKSGNYYKQISIQDTTGGITIRMDGTSLYTSYPVGRKVFIKLNGLFMGDYNGLIQLGGSIDNTGQFLNVRPIASNLFDTYIVKGSLNNVVTPKVVTIADLNDTYQSMLIQINDAEFATGDVNKTYADAINQLSANVNVTPCAGGSIIVRTSGYCSFAGINVPDGNGKLLSIFTVFGTTKQLIVRDTTDVQFYNPTRCTAGGGGGGDAPFTSIEALRNLYAGTDVDIASNRIKGIVISGGPGKNISAGNIVLQDGNRGITLYFGSPAASALAAFQIGDSLVVDISGGTLTSYNGLLEVTLSSTAVPASAAGLASAGSGLSVVTKDMTIAELNANIATVENTMVRIVNATATPAGTYSGNKTLTDASGTMLMRTVATATFAGSTLPTTCQNWVGYPGRFNNDKQLYIRNPATDVTAGTSCGTPPPPGGGITLTTSPFLLNFDGIGTGLPTGVTVKTTATASALGTDATFNSSNATGIWTKTGSGFKNFASATGLTAATDSATQANSTNRALGIRQTSSFGDPGAAFVFQVDNTTGKTNFSLDFLLQSLDATNAPRTITWKVDYGTGDAPAAFTLGSTTGTMTTGNNIFSSTPINVTFGGALDNQSVKVWIRIVTLSSSTGSGNRASTAVDDFKLTWN